MRLIPNTKSLVEAMDSQSSRDPELRKEPTNNSEVTESENKTPVSLEEAREVKIKKARSQSILDRMSVISEACAGSRDPELSQEEGFRDSGLGSDASGDSGEDGDRGGSTEPSKTPNPRARSAQPDPESRGMV